ncbi:C-type lectin lectoxin-Thr1-like [Branchiostoma floridae x Branchiostoma belcheri]
MEFTLPAAAASGKRSTVNMTLRYHQHSGNTNEYYKVFAELMTYEVAKQTCVSHGGHLADVKTHELHDFILSKIQKVDRGRDYWIGLNDLTVENSWTWSDGTPVSDGVFTNWAPGEPNNGAGNGQDCGKLWEKEGFKWDDETCGNENYFICQIPNRF